MTAPGLLRPYSLDDRYALEDGRVFVTGVQALVRALVDQRRHDRRAGLRTATLVTGYEGSPLGGLDLEIGRAGRVLGDHDVVHQPAVNEELAATAVTGTQLLPTLGSSRYDGVVGVWYGKAPGFDRAADAVRHGNHIGVTRTSGALLAVGDDAGAKSSTLPSASETLAFALQVPMLAPADPQEVLDLALHGVAMSRASGLWSALKIGTDVADGSATVDVSPERFRPVVPTMELDGVPYEHRPSARLAGQVNADLERSLTSARLAAALRYAVANDLNRIDAGPADRVGIVASGKTWLDLHQALRSLGVGEQQRRSLGIRLLKLGLVWPLDGTTIREFASGLESVVVVEEKRSFLELLVKDQLYGLAAAPPVAGRLGEDGRPLLPSHGELGPDVIARHLGRYLAGRLGSPALEHPTPAADRPPRASIPLAVRTPYFCSGCPHNRSLRAPEGSVVGAGIGCHGMAVLMPSEQVGDVIGLTQMGGEGAQWIGMAPFTEQSHLIQNVGDGTFFHSASLAVRAAVAAGVNITYKLLFNSAVAMTGGQEVIGARTVPDLCRLLLAEGVSRVVVTTPEPGRYRGVDLGGQVEVRHRDELVRAQEQLAAVAGVTVLVHEDECAAEKRRKRKRGRSEDPPTRIFINERLCEGCGDCGVKSNCLSVRPVDTDLGRKTEIHQASCNKDYSCLDGDCPSFLTVTPKPGRAAGARTPAAPPVVEHRLDADDSPEPDRRVEGDGFVARLTGIGGTGVITLAQVLGTAAMLDGWRVRGMDQTGTAQKGGAVVSDVKLFGAGSPAAHKAAGGECDLYLGCDLLVAADARYLDTASRERTVPVVSTAAVPTGAMVFDPAVEYPAVGRVVDRVRAGCRADQGMFLDAHARCRTLFGGDEVANTFLAGVAYQLGMIPISASALERALELNGVAVDANVQAFRWGRRAVADPEPSSSEGRPAVAADPGSELEAVVAWRVDDLVAYQSRRYAERYARLVARVRAVEAERVPGTDALTLGVARHLYKLMAYKDEYEVARLALDPEVERRLVAEFGPGASYRWMLHPPTLRRFGMSRKLRLGPWFRPVLRALRALRFLRGTPFDPFGLAGVRRVERSLVREYEEVVEEIVAVLGPHNHSTAVTLAGLPDMVRGYEGVKLAAVERYHGELARRRADLTSDRAATEKEEETRWT